MSPDPESTAGATRVPDPVDAPSGPVREIEAAERLGFAPRSPSPDLRRLIARGRLRRAHVLMSGEPTWERGVFEEERARLWNEHHAWCRTFDPGSPGAARPEAPADHAKQD